MMAKKNVEERGSKSDAARKYLKKHPKASVLEIMEALAEQGISISSALAGKIRYGKGKVKHQPVVVDDEEDDEDEEGEVVPVRKPAKASSNGEVTIGQLKRAKEFVADVGGLHKALSVLQAYVEFLDDAE